MLAIAGGAVAASVVAYVHRYNLTMLLTPDMYALPLDQTGYTVERLPFDFQVSFARGHDVYFADEDGKVFEADDRDPAGTLKELGHCHLYPRMLFVTSSGTIFASRDTDPPVVRSIDGGKTWQQSLDWAFWRMDEDEATHALYAGNYTAKTHEVFRATVFKSADEGSTWDKVMVNPDVQHIHTLRYDDRYGRIYIATGDRQKYRGQAYSDDGGKTWRKIARGRGQGHTDVAFTDDFAVWGSDDKCGRIILAPRDKVDFDQERTVLRGRRQQIWSVTAEGKQIYVGTACLNSQRPDGMAFLLASSDQGKTWQKLLQHRRRDGNDTTFLGDSRRLSADGWLFISDGDGTCYRVRKTPPTR